MFIAYVRFTVEGWWFVGQKGHVCRFGTHRWFVKLKSASVATAVTVAALPTVPMCTWMTRASQYAKGCT